MNVVEGFDGKFGWTYRFVLVGFCLASLIFMAVSLLIMDKLSMFELVRSILLSIFSVAVSVFAYVMTLRKARSFPFFCGAVVAFALASYGFGISWRTYAIIGVLGLVAGVWSLRLGKLADLRDEDDV